MLRPFFGITKVLYAVVTFLATCFNIAKHISRDIEFGRYSNIYVVSFGFFVVFIYSIYLSYSGWTELREIKIKHPILNWIGLSIGLAIGGLVFYAAVVPLQYAIAIITTTFSVQEITRLLTNKSSNHKNETTA